MSDQIHTFDQLFRDKLGNHVVTPPEAAWSNIVEQRDFGHIVSKNIISYWRGLSILLLLMLLEGNGMIVKTNTNNFIFAQKEELNTLSNHKINQQIIEDSTDVNLSDKILENQKLSIINKKINKKKVINIEPIHVPDIDLIASLGQAAFSIPEVSDPLLNSYIKHLEGWETAKPISFVRYNHLNKMSTKSVYKEQLANIPIKPNHLNYDYALTNYLVKKPFKKRISIVFAFTPQQIKKSMKANYNLSTSYLRERRKTENLRMAYTATALLHYELKKNTFLESGINYIQIYEEMHYENEKRFSNQYKFVELPLLYGYEVRGAKWGWMIKGGVGVQLYNSYKGYILKKTADATLPAGSSPLNPQYRMRKGDAVKNMITNSHSLSAKQDRRGVMDLENSEENPFKKAGVVNLHIAAGLTYYHSIKTSFILSPVYSRSINSITNEDARFVENINYFGFSLGSRIKF